MTTWDWKEDLHSAVSRRFKQMHVLTFTDVVDLFESQFELIFRDYKDNDHIKIERGNGITFWVFEYGLSLSYDSEQEKITVSKLKNDRLIKIDELSNTDGYFPIEEEGAEELFAQALFDLWQPSEEYPEEDLPEDFGF